MYKSIHLFPMSGENEKKLAGVFFVDLIAACDTINSCRVLNNILCVTNDQAFVQILREILKIRKF